MIIKQEEILTRLHMIKGGCEHTRNALIRDYDPFIVNIVSKTINTYVDLNHSDEYSIGLLAFNEAIDGYDASKGSFLAYAGLVIRNRIIDHKRKGRISTVALSDIDHDPVLESDFTKDIEIRDEIHAFSSLLEDFNISLDDLVEESPKQMRGRIRSIKMGRYVVGDSDLKANFYRLKRLPISLLSKVFEIAIKTIKRTKKFTIACTLVIDSKLSILKSRLLEIEKEVIDE